MTGYVLVRVDDFEAVLSAASQCSEYFREKYGYTYEVEERLANAGEPGAAGDGYARAVHEIASMLGMDSHVSGHTVDDVLAHVRWLEERARRTVQSLGNVSDSAETQPVGEQSDEGSCAEDRWVPEDHAAIVMRFVDGEFVMTVLFPEGMKPAGDGPREQTGAAAIGFADAGVAWLQNECGEVEEWEAK